MVVLYSCRSCAIVTPYLIHAKFDPHQFWGGRGPPTSNFTKTSEYKRPTGAYPLGNFTKFSLFWKASWTVNC